MAGVKERYTKMLNISESNFKRAVNELWGSGLGQSAQNNQTDRPDPFVRPEETDEPEQSQPFPFRRETISEPEPMEAPAPEPTPSPRINPFLQKEEDMVMPPAVMKEEAVIPFDMVINGSVSAKSDMRIMGHIIGDVKCTGDINLSGNIHGNVDAANLFMHSGSLKGDVIVRETVALDNEAQLKGDISAQNIRSNAHTEGNIQASALVELQEKASILGDIATGALSVHTGAKIKGMVDVRE